MSVAFVSDHPYMMSGLIGLAITFALWLVAGPQRRTMLLAGIIFVPFCPIAGLFSDGSYWTNRHVDLGSISPVHWFGGPVGIEDALFLFVAGARSWFFATFTRRAQWRPAGSARDFAVQATAITAAAFVGLAAFRRIGIGDIASSYVIPAAIGVALLLANPERWQLALSGGTGAALLAMIELRAWFVLWPQLRASWNPLAATSSDILGVPAGDLLWWLIVGAVHPLVIARCARVRRISPPLPQADQPR